MRRAAAAACAAALAGCGSSDLASPFSAVAVTYDVNRGAFKLAQVRVNTLTSLQHLQGSSGDVTSGGTIEVNNAAIRAAGATPASLRNAFIKSQPFQVQLAWNTLNDIVYPEDFDSLELLSTYYNMEKARAAVADWGLTSLPARPVIANANLSDEKGLSPLPDGELYYPPLATFFAPAATPQAQVPAAFNLGAVAHALGHEAIEELVWGGAVLPAPELAAGSDPATIVARHVARSMTEGISDYLGVSVSDDPRWYDHSLQQDASSRALDSTHCGDPTMLDALSVDDAQAPYDPYPLGSVIASTLWDEGSASTNQNTAKGVVSALPALAAAGTAGITLAAVLDALAASSPDEQKGDLCGMLLNRFAPLKLQASDLPSCGGVKVVAHQECSQ